MKHKLTSMSLATLSLLPAGIGFAQQGGAAAAEKQSAEKQVVETKQAAAAVSGAQGEGKLPGASGGDQSKPAAQSGAGAAGASKGAASKAGVNAQAQPNMMVGQPPVPPKPAYTQFKLNPKTTMFLDFTDANPDMLISLFSRTSGITILKDPSFKTLITVTSAKAVPLKEAFEIFDTVLGLNGFTLTKQGNLMIVSRRNPPQPQIIQQPAPPPPPQAPVVKPYTIMHASADKIAKVINEVFGAAGAPVGGGQPNFQPNFQPGQPPGGQPGGRPTGVKATSEEYSNIVIVTAMPKDQTDVAALIKELDIVSSTPLDSEVFQLKYVPIDQVLTAVEDVLTANSPQGKGSGGSSNNRNQGYNYYDYYGFGGGGGNKHSSGGQSATVIKQTNSIIVNAIHQNMEIIRKLIDSLDKPAEFAGTSFVIKLQNAKASDVADLLNKVLTQRANPNDNNGFFIFGPDFGGSSSNKNKALNTDLNEKGEIVNVRDIIGKVNIVADPNTNSLLIVTQPSNMKPIRDMVDKIDQVAEQVMIETVIVEANLDKTTKLGVQWTMLPSKIFSGPGTSGSGGTDFGLNPTPQNQGVNYTITAGQYKSFLNAMQTDAKFKVLDTPRIFTSNNVKAEINVSQKIPYITTQTTNSLGNVVSNYTFQDVGVVLTVTPRITANGNVTMDVVQSADDLQGFTSFNAPIINTRKASTTVSVADGATIVLGGIIRHTLTQTDKRIPFFGDLPILGNLFRSTDKTAGQTELMVFLTPHIVHTADAAARIRKVETERMSKSSQADLKKIIKPGSGG